MAGQRVGVIGAGILGLAVAREIGLRLPRSEVTVLEKEDRVAAHQTGHNSGVVHAGLYYQPGSLKARLCRRGATLLHDYARERGIPYDECGKLVVAIRPEEIPGLREIQARSLANGVPDVRWVESAGITELEPHTVGVAALHSPRTAITDFVAVARSYADDVAAAGGRVRLGFRVDGLEQRASEVVVRSGDEALVFDHLIVCAGLHSDTVAGWAGDDAAPAIVPFRGEYYRLRPDKADLVKGLIYPVPDPRYPFLGVHFTRRVDGGVDVGPNAVLALAREGYRRHDIDLAELRQMLAWPGFRRMARQHWRMGARELAGSFSKSLFLRFARQYVPEVRAADLEPAPAGVRAQALDRDGSLVDDFRISGLGRVLAVRNAPSPGATSSLAIAEHVTDEWARAHAP